MEAIAKPLNFFIFAAASMSSSDPAPLAATTGILT